MSNLELLTKVEEWVDENEEEVYDDYLGEDNFPDYHVNSLDLIYFMRSILT